MLRRTCLVEEDLVEPPGSVPNVQAGSGGASTTKGEATFDILSAALVGSEDDNERKTEMETSTTIGSSQVSSPSRTLFEGSRDWANRAWVRRTVSGTASGGGTSPVGSIKHNNHGIFFGECVIEATYQHQRSYQQAPQCLVNWQLDRWNPNLLHFNQVRLPSSPSHTRACLWCSHRSVFLPSKTNHFIACTFFL